MVRKILEIVLRFGIVASLAILVLETVPSLKPLYFAMQRLEVSIFLLFSIEYIVRTFLPKEHKPIPLIDILTICAYLLSLIPGTHPLLMMARWIAVLKLTRYTVVDNQLLEAFRKIKHQLVPYSMLLLVVTLICSTGMYYAEREAQPDKFTSIPASLYWGFVTLTTVGYGDVTPVTTSGRVVAVMAVLAGVVVLAPPIALFTQAFLDVHKK